MEFKFQGSIVGKLDDRNFFVTTGGGRSRTTYHPTLLGAMRSLHATKAHSLEATTFPKYLKELRALNADFLADLTKVLASVKD